MAEKLTMWTYDWVPAGARGFVRDLRLRWAAEEASLAYDVRTVPFEDRETNHLDSQSFGQVPFLADGNVKIFESGAGLLHLARKSEKLMPRDASGGAETLQWAIAALNSIEMVTVPWWFLKVSGQEDNGLADWMGKRLAQLEAVLSERDWLAADRFTVADLTMADVLRVSEVRAHGERPATEAMSHVSPPVPRSERLILTKSRISRRRTMSGQTTDDGRVAKVVEIGGACSEAWW